MKKLNSAILAATVGLTVLAGPAAAQDTGSVVIHRGAAVETVRFDNRGKIEVVRGQPAVKPGAPKHRAGRHHAGRHGVGRHGVGRTVAGDTLWIVDGGGARLVACRLERTTQVGGRRIRCTERSLPVARR